jgi:type II secretory pathway pseudopilin PulG
MGLAGQDHTERGYAMAALLVALGVMAVIWTMAVPTWRHMIQRDREDELVFRGQQYARAIALFQRKYASTFPPNLDVLLDQKFLRRRYTDPVAKGEDKTFQLLYQNSQGAAPGQLGQGQPAGQGSQTSPGPLPRPGQAGGMAGGIIGVVSKSRESSIRVYNGRTRYNEWQFLAVEATQRPGGGGAGAGGRPPGGRNPGDRPAPGAGGGVGPTPPVRPMPMRPSVRP